MIDDMLANGSLIKDDPFSPTYTAAAVAGKLVMALGPTWFGDFVMKPAYKFPPKSVGIGLPPKWSYQSQPLTWSWGGGTWGIWKGQQAPRGGEALVSCGSDHRATRNQEKGVTMAGLPAGVRRLGRQAQGRWLLCQRRVVLDVARLRPRHL